MSRQHGRQWNLNLPNPTTSDTEAKRNALDHALSKALDEGNYGTATEILGEIENLGSDPSADPEEE